MLGRAVAERAGGRGAGERAGGPGRGWEVHAPGHGELDVTDTAAVGAAVREIAPDVVINCAAWTDVDGAESEPEAALRVNAAGARHVARAAADSEALAIHISTDYVFAGDGKRAYVESDLTDPRSAYGRSKLAGELEVLAASTAHIVVRSSWLFGAGGRNFVDTMLALGEERDEVSVVDDQVGCPTWTVHLAAGLLDLAERRAGGADAGGAGGADAGGAGGPDAGGAGGADAGGIYHVAGAGSCSWYELAREVFEQAGMACRVVPTTTAATRRPAPRPAFSVLASERPDAPRLPSWREGVRGYLAQRRVPAGRAAR